MKREREQDWREQDWREVAREIETEDYGANYITLFLTLYRGDKAIGGATKRLSRREARALRNRLDRFLNHLPERLRK